MSDLERLFARHRAQAPAMARTTAAERRERLVRLVRAVEARREAVAEALRQDLGRPRAEAEIGDLYPALHELRLAARRVRRWMRPRRTGFSLVTFSTTSRVVYRPRGTSLILAPFNYPFSLVIMPLASAIAAGCTAICKPSERTPHTAAVLRKVMAEACDPSEAALVEGGPEVAQGLLTLPFDHVFFTGSAAVGRRVMVAAAAHLTSVTLELGGKAPAVVDGTMDPDRAAARVVMARFFNAGQTCIAVDYALVQEAHAPAFVAALARAVAAAYGEDDAAQRASPDLGRIVDAQHGERVRGLVERSIAAGARLVTGGAVDAAERYVAPTVLADVTPDMPVMQEEIFGPVLPVLTWRTREDLLGTLRRFDHPLAQFVFSEDRGLADWLVRETSAGATIVNTAGLHYLNANLPFGGMRTSGVGSAHGESGFLAFSHPRVVLRQHEPALLPLFSPPYHGRLKRLGQWVLRHIA